MLLIPLPFVATLLLLVLLAFALKERMNDHAVRVFAALIALYAMQSFLMGLRWGYGWEAVAAWITAVAAVMPAMAWLAYTQIIRRFRLSDGLHVLPVLMLWGLRALESDLVDPLIILLYLAYGFALVLRAWKGLDHLALARIDGAIGSHRALWITGLILIGSGLADVFIVVDFMRTGGQSVGIVISTAQIVSVVLVAVAAHYASQNLVVDLPPPQTPPGADAETSDTADRIARLFTHEKAHRDLELNLRRIARKLGLTDRAVSNAINRTHGISVSQYVNNFRVAEAQHLLVTTGQPVIQIALDAGFLSKSNFNREFQRVTGQSPSQYRAANTA